PDENKSTTEETTFVLKPGLALRILIRLCKSNPVPASKMKLSETCTSTSAERNRDRLLPPRTPPASALSAFERSTSLERIAGTSANNRVDAMQIPALAASTRQSIWPGKSITVPGNGGGNASTSALRHQYATAIPPTAAMSESNNPSVTNCLTRRLRPAPSARRIVISCRRNSDRASKRLLTLAHAISKTKNTTAIVIASVDVMFPAPLKGVFHNGTSWFSWPRFVSGKSF